MKKLFTLCAALMMLSASAGNVTVFEGTATSQDIPVCSRFMDWSPYTHQVIYPEAQLTDLVGKDITAVKYFVANEDGSTLNGGLVSLYIGTTDVNNFGGYSVSYVPADGLTKVAEMAMPLGAQEIEFTFDNAWNYAGGNIVIQTVIESDGSVVGSTATDFLGVEADAASACGNWSVSAKDFGPMTAFIFEGGEQPQITLGDVDMDGNVGITDVAALIDYILNGDDTGICVEACDCDQNGNVGITDVAALIDYILNGVWE